MSAPMHPTFEKMLINYLLAVILQRVHQRKTPVELDPAVPDWVPRRIRLTTVIKSQDGTSVVQPGEYDCETNVWGAIVVFDGSGRRLGVYLHECEVIALGPNRKKQSQVDDSTKQETVP